MKKIVNYKFVWSRENLPRLHKTLSDKHNDIYYQAFKDDPKTALSSMAKLVEVCNAYRHEEIIQQTVQLYFERFIEDTILPLTIEQKLDSFAAVGSIAYHFHQEIETAAKKHRLTLEKVIQYPASNLIQYHLKRIM